MKTFLNLRSWLVAMTIGIFISFSACKEDIIATAPSISITPVATESIPGGTVDFTITVSSDANAGANLSSVSLNGVEIKTYSANVQQDVFTYAYTFPEKEEDDQELTFSVADDDGGSMDMTATALVQYIQPDYTLLDFSNLTSETALWGDWWESADPSTVTLNVSPGATYQGGDASPSAYVVSRGGFANPAVWDFNSMGPNGSESSLLMNRRVLENTDGTTAWGGYMIPVFGYYDADNGQTKLLESEMNAVKNNARVIAVDVYFEETAGSPASFSDLSSFRETADDQGAIKDKDGVKVQLRLGSLLKFQARETGTDDGFFLIREAYITAPGEWQTLYFDVTDPGEKGIPINAGADEIDMVWLVPVYAYPNFEYNNIYLKNFRITNPE